MKSIGILGGTFDPIHNGHIAIAQKVQERYCLDEVVFVPSGNPPHKKERRITDASHRLAMVKEAIKDMAGFSFSTMEIDRKGYSYALDTVNEFYEIYGNDIDLYFITGADAIAEIATWHRADELMKKCSFIAAARPGYHIGEAYRNIEEKFENRLFLFEETAHNESSSEIRERIANGCDVSAMLPEDVEGYIREHGLYKEL